MRTRTMLVSVCLVCSGYLSPMAPAAGPASPSPSPPADPLTRGHAIWSDAPWDGPAIEIMLSKDVERTTTAFPPRPPWLAFKICISEDRLQAVPLDLKPGEKVGYSSVISVSGKPNVRQDGWTLKITTFDPDEFIEGSYDVLTVAGVHIRGTFKAKGPGGHWGDGRLRGH